MSIKKTVQDSDGARALERAAVDALRAEMAAAHPLHTFSHHQCTDAWLLPAASVDSYGSV